MSELPGMRGEAGDYGYQKPLGENAFLQFVQRPRILAVQQVPGAAQMRQLSDLHTRTVHRADMTAARWMAGIGHVL